MENSNRCSTREIMSSGDSNTSLEHSSATKTVSCSLDTETVGSKGVIKRSEFIKIMTSSLYSLGYNKTAAALEEESGIPLHPSKLKLLEQLVMEGKWEECVGMLSTTDLWDGETIKLATFLLLEQKFLDLLKMVKVNDATRTLREEIVPLGVNMTRVYELSSCLIAPPERLISGQDVGGANSRLQIVEKLKNLLPPSVLVPGKRLEHLLEMAFYVQPNYCWFHNILDGDMSLCSDHQCGRNYIPSETLQGSDCVHPFVALQNCIKANPNAFSKDILEDEEAEKKQQEQPQPVKDGKIIPLLWSRESSRAFCDNIVTL